MKLKSLALNITTVGGVLIIWWAISVLGLVAPIFLPSPAATFSELVYFLVSGKFFLALGASFARIMAATIAAAAVGILIGVAMGISQTVEDLLSPITQPLRYLPITALVPLLILWFGIGETMRVAFLFFGIVFYFIPLVQNALRSVPEEYIDVARGFGAHRFAIIRRVYLPHALPQIIHGLIVINGIGWTYVVLAEIINAPNGLGYLIHIAGRLQRTDEVFAGIILIAAIAILSDRALHRVRNAYFFW